MREFERPRIPYSALIVDVSPHQNLTREEIIQYRAVDFMLDALRRIHPLINHFADNDLTVGDIERLKVPGSRDLLVGVHTPEDLIVAVGENTRTERVDEETRTYEGELCEWGERMKAMVEAADLNDDGLDAQARELVKDVLAKEAPVLGLELATQKV